MAVWPYRIMDACIHGMGMTVWKYDCMGLRAVGHDLLLSYRTEQQWRDLAHCLTQINFTERCMRKLQDNFHCYQDKLVDQDIYTSFTSIANKAKKFAKPEAKVGGNILGGKNL